MWEYLDLVGKVRASRVHAVVGLALRASAFGAVEDGQQCDSSVTSLPQQLQLLQQQLLVHCLFKGQGSGLAEVEFGARGMLTLSSTSTNFEL